MNNQGLDIFTEERSVEYQGRKFLARDNGAILRLPKERCRPSKYDNIWTFGVQDKRTGYMLLASLTRVHQVVARAFLGDPPEPNLVVDHIDTNRCNNRPENLRWVTRLENALNNPITRKRIIARCGSIEAFLANPALLRESDLDQNNQWMRTVSKEEAAKCRRNLERWAAMDSLPPLKGKGLGEWIFDDTEPWDKEFTPMDKDEARKLLEEATVISDDELEYEGEEEENVYESLTPNVRQLNWRTPTHFLFCPKKGEPQTLQEYFNHLKIGERFNQDNYGNYGVILDFGLDEEKEILYVLTHKDDGIHQWGLCKIYLKDGFFIHDGRAVYHSEDGGRQHLAMVLGQEWDGPDNIDNYT